MSYAFAKYQGLGNDFIIIDNRASGFPTREIPALCKRRLNIGADGVILLEEGPRMRIYNADGSEAEMCGNGIRCLAAYLYDRGIVTEEFSIQSQLRSHHISIHGDGILVEMGSPRITNLSKEFSLLDTGVPHGVLFVDDLENAPVLHLGKSLRQQHNCNINFAQVFKNHLKIRTYERGVEDETLACATGATASAIAASKLFGLTSPVQVEVASHESLEISFSSDLSQVQQKGRAKKVFEGSFCLPHFSPPLENHLAQSSH